MPPPPTAPFPGTPHLLGILVWGLALLLVRSRFRFEQRASGQKLIVIAVVIGLLREATALVSAALSPRGIGRPVGAAVAVEVWVENLVAFLLISGFLLYLFERSTRAGQYLRFAIPVQTVGCMGAAAVLLANPPSGPPAGLSGPMPLALVMALGVALQLVGGVVTWREVAGRPRSIMLAAIGFYATAGTIRTLGSAHVVPFLGPPGDIVYSSTAASVGVVLFGYLCVQTHFSRARSDFEALEERLRARTSELESALTDLSAANLRLVEQSTVDSLTGVRNRRHFDDVLYNEWKRAARTRVSLAVALIDLDCFKDVNDHYGHAMGDECLACVAATLKEHARRPGDVVARYGGDEFALLLPNADEANALAVLDEVRRKVESRGKELGPRLTISAGAAACVPGSGSVPENLIQQADEHLYSAKQAGRNNVRGRSEAVETSRQVS